jgi:hypothetical protein
MYFKEFDPEKLTSSLPKKHPPYAESMHFSEEILTHLKGDANTVRFSFVVSTLNKITKFLCRLETFELIKRIAWFTETKSFV